MPSCCPSLALWYLRHLDYGWKPWFERCCCTCDVSVWQNLPHGETSSRMAAQISKPLTDQEQHVCPCAIST